MLPTQAPSDGHRSRQRDAPDGHEPDAAMKIQF
jgi:hypothetical protein